MSPLGAVPDPPESSLGDVVAEGLALAPPRRRYDPRRLQANGWPYTEAYCPACRCNRSGNDEPNERCEPCTDPSCACHDEDIAWDEPT